MKKQIPSDLFRKFLNGECNAQEEAAVKEWYNSFVNDDDHLSALGNVQKADVKMRIRKVIDNNIALHEAGQPEVAAGKGISKSMVYYALTGIAASLLVFFGVRLLNYTASPAGQVKAPALVNVINTTKVIREQVLSDGSHIWLYPGAKITFAKKFTGNTREISMSGESFFEISKNPAKPFIIHSRHIITKVWGTSFRVRDAATANFADVAVITGKVSVKAVNPANGQLKEVMLHPNEQITYLNEQKELKAGKVVQNSGLNIWRKTDLSFNGAPLKEVMGVLNKRFNVNIVASDQKLNAYLLDADFNGLNLVSIMDILKKTLNISYEMNNDAIVLKNNN